mmetsp:Transcript_10519/g.14401  ORF Transcript_10519/g.14401 Transcript_10519/m.14401 type:complete len:102 (+) Transcript_10519:263-568(+)
MSISILLLLQLNKPKISTGSAIFQSIQFLRKKNTDHCGIGIPPITNFTFFPTFMKPIWKCWLKQCSPSLLKNAGEEHILAWAKTASTYDALAAYEECDPYS